MRRPPHEILIGACRAANAQGKRKEVRDYLDALQRVLKKKNSAGADAVHGRDRSLGTLAKRLCVQYCRSHPTDRVGVAVDYILPRLQAAGFFCAPSTVRKHIKDLFPDHLRKGGPKPKK